MTLYEKEPLVGFAKEKESIDVYIARLRSRPGFDFTGRTILDCSSSGGEVFIQDGEYYRGLTPSNTHLLRQFELMRDVLFWRMKLQKEQEKQQKGLRRIWDWLTHTI